MRAIKDKTPKVRDRKNEKWYRAQLKYDPDDWKTAVKLKFRRVAQGHKAGAASRWSDGFVLGPNDSTHNPALRGAAPQTHMDRKE